MLTENKTQQHNEFKAAKEIALNITKGCSRRARYNGNVTNYTGFKDNSGRSFVIGDTDADIQNSTITIGGKPSREVFEGFAVISK